MRKTVHQRKLKMYRDRRYIWIVEKQPVFVVVGTVQFFVLQVLGYFYYPCFFKTVAWLSIMLAYLPVHIRGLMTREYVRMHRYAPSEAKHFTGKRAVQATVFRMAMLLAAIIFMLVIEWSLHGCFGFYVP